MDDVTVTKQLTTVDRLKMQRSSLERTDLLPQTTGATRKVQRLSRLAFEFQILCGSVTRSHKMNINASLLNMYI